ncbi:ATP-binding cassette domain-containing protein [Flavobacterium sp. MC2016-06]|uniref:ATP-binding cassette domain-containing protein n=1 Tax=Flavobacterium sp. MC2016-06 TaxID=2676308 RepID=UPI0012BA8E33|nr:ATP-binding cassette domain-containing protein [Flavobacterium sp. MC2016-06]MBU3858269.1 ATP-binding cassette domain-containing protein [Flavobacterium sp. MC2016-06]
MSFKLLAIRPLAGDGFLKNLKKNEFYTFYNDYGFEINSENNLITINHNPTVPLDLYYDDIGNKINISAIVGKNGSGKSSIMELLYATIYNYSVKKGLIYNEVKDIEENDFSRDEFKIISDVIQKSNFDNDLIDSIDSSIEVLNKLKEHIKSSLPTIESNIEYLDIHVQLFYVLKGLPRMLQVKKDFVEICDFEEENSLKFNLDLREKSKEFSENQVEKNALELFFYNIVNNYSLYGLNSNEIGDWISYIFHKNDEYQTPIVINPMRTEGKIDINTENDLSKSRLLSNVLTFVPEDEKLTNSFRCLVQDKIASSLILNLKVKKYTDKKDQLEFKYYDLHKEIFLLNILNSFTSHEYENEVSKNELAQRLEENNLIDKFIIEYIFRKIEKIAKTYKIGRYKYKDKFSYDNLHVVTDFITQLKSKQTHITFKLRQAINFFKYYRNYASLNNLLNFETDINYVANISIKDLSDDINNQINELAKLYSNNKSFVAADKKEFYFKPSALSLINFIIPSIFEIDIKFENNMGSFNFLSSGEKQSVYSINTILYHIMNIESIHNSDNLKEYRYINLILDEIELYFHPEMQRSFVKKLLDKIKKINTLNIDLNIIFITHSPFILSDIPKQNVLFLEIDEISKQAKPSIYEGYNTFGANIHEMLTNGFFLESTKGAFTISKINDFLDFYKKKDEKTKEDFIEKKASFKGLISLIGEDYVRKILENHFDELESLYMGKNLLTLEKERLIGRLEEIEKLKG